MNGNTVVTLVFSCLLAALGVLFTVKPLLMWRFTESWKPGSEDGPQPEYMRYARTVGIILAVIGVGLLVLTVVDIVS